MRKRAGMSDEIGVSRPPDRPRSDGFSYARFLQVNLACFTCQPIFVTNDNSELSAGPKTRRKTPATLHVEAGVRTGTIPPSTEISITFPRGLRSRARQFFDTSTFSNGFRSFTFKALYSAAISARILSIPSPPILSLPHVDFSSPNQPSHSPHFPHVPCSVLPQRSLESSGVAFLSFSYVLYSDARELKCAPPEKTNGISPLPSLFNFPFVRSRAADGHLDYPFTAIMLPPHWKASSSSKRNENRSPVRKNGKEPDGN